MEIANALKILWDKRLLVVIGLLVAQLVAWASAFQITFPPTLESKSLEFGAATTQVLLDTSQSPLFDPAASVEPLASRAELYVQLVTTPPVHQAISKAAGTARGELVISSRSASTGTKSSREPTSEQRANQLATEMVPKRILFAAGDGLPIISIFSQAETSAEAVRLAEAGAEGLIGYLRALRNRQSLPQGQQITFRQLGPAQGEVVNDGASLSFGLLILGLLFSIWCIGIVVLTNLVAAFREQRDRGACSNCGSALEAGARFCPSCGRPIGSSADDLVATAHRGEDTPHLAAARER